MSRQLIQINREMFDHKNKERFVVKAPEGITEEVVRMISKKKNEPEWMLQKRLRALHLFNEMPLPTWGPSLAKLNLNKITYYAQTDEKAEANSWEDVPEDIRKTFEKLGIPEAERKSLSGVGAQYDSEVVYHNLKKQWGEKGVIFENMDIAVKKFEHTLIIVDKNAEVSYIEGCSAPYYTKNNLHAGCVEIYVMENARARYSSIENWSKNTYNLNTKRAIVNKNATMEWVNGNMGSNITMLYPCTVLRGEYARADFTGIAFAGKNQNQDTGCKMIHLAENTSSTIKSKSISKDGGITTYRGLLKIIKGAKNVNSSIRCDALLLDDISKTNTIPRISVKENTADVVHEATVGRIDEESIFYLMSRGISEEEARKMIVSGFIEPITKQLPGEYAIELNRLIELEMEDSIG